MGYKQQLMTLIMGGISRKVELVFNESTNRYLVEAFIYQGNYFEVVLAQQPLKEKLKIPLEGILHIEQLTDKAYRIDYAEATVFLYGKS